MNLEDKFKITKEDIIINAFGTGLFLANAYTFSYLGVMPTLAFLGGTIALGYNTIKVNNDYNSRNSQRQ